MKIKNDRVDLINKVTTLGLLSAGILKISLDLVGFRISIMRLERILLLLSMGHLIICILKREVLLLPLKIHIVTDLLKQDILLIRIKIDILSLVQELWSVMIFLAIFPISIITSSILNLSSSKDQKLLKISIRHLGDAYMTTATDAISITQLLQLKKQLISIPVL